MSDVSASDLRTRIAAVMAELFCEDRCGTTIGHSPCPDCLELFLPQADKLIRELLPTREGRWGWLDGTVSTNPATGNPIKLEIEPGEVTPLSVDDARDVALALLAAVAECGSSND